MLKAFAGESQARSRYVFFASKARKEGFEQIAAAVFAETAEQEKEHAEFFSLPSPDHRGQRVDIPLRVDAGELCEVYARSSGSVASSLRHCSGFAPKSYAIFAAWISGTHENLDY